MLVMGAGNGALFFQISDNSSLDKSFQLIALPKAVQFNYVNNLSKSCRHTIYTFRKIYFSGGP